MVAGYAAKEMVERGLKSGELLIVLPRTRSPTSGLPSKSFLAGKDDEEQILISPESFYREHGIRLEVGSEVRRIDISKNILSLQSGGGDSLEKLIIATGAAVKLSGDSRQHLAWIHYLRSLADSKRIRTHANDAKRAVVVGSGFIAMEVSSVLAQKGVETVMVVRDDRVFKKIFTPEMSHAFETYFAARGVRFIKQSEVKEARGEGRLTSVVLGDGRTLDCDLMVAGIGVQPLTRVAAESGIDVADGVLVNEYLETGVPGIYAAGDVADCRGRPLFGKRRRVEHWDNAVSQGKHSGGALMGERAPFVHVPYFFSDMFDLSYELWGDTSGAGEVIVRGDISSTSFSVWWLAGERLIAAFTMNRSDEERDAAPRWINPNTVLPPKN